jgi:hypothetical protein
VIYKFGGFRQPINLDGPSVFKLGSTVPVKCALTDATTLLSVTRSPGSASFR